MTAKSIAPAAKTRSVSPKTSTVTRSEYSSPSQTPSPTMPPLLAGTAQILALQGAVGNMATARWVRRKEGDAGASGGPVSQFIALVAQGPSAKGQLFESIRLLSDLQRGIVFADSSARDALNKHYHDDDLWFALKLLEHGRESNWPLMALLELWLRPWITAERLVFDIKQMTPERRVQALRKLQEAKLLDGVMAVLKGEGIALYQQWMADLAGKPAQSLDKRIAATPNAKRAAVAKKELEAKKSSDKHSPARLTSPLIDLMVMSVATPMNADAKGQAGTLGIDSANNAADALLLMADADYMKILGLLLMSGGEQANTSRMLEQATLLKAVAARKADLIAAGPQTKAQLATIETFANDIRNMDKDKLVEATHGADRGSGRGLKQRYTMSCGPTSIEIVHSEVDPIYAKELSDETAGKHTLDPTGKAADRQKKLLEGVNGADTAVPRVVEDDWGAATKAMSAHLALASTSAADKQALAALINYISGKPFDSAKKDAGVALLKTLTPAIPVDKRVDEWKKFYTYLGNAPGLNNPQFSAMAKSELGATTGRNFTDTEISYKAKLVAGKTEFKGTIAKHIKPLDKALFRGNSVPFGVMWAAGGGHFMVFTDMRSERKGKKTITSYLVSDPWEGKSGWMTRQDLINGAFQKIGHSQGAIDSIYI